MDTLKKLPLEVQVVLGGALLYVVFSFFDWQQVSFLSAHAGISEWHGIGVIAALLAIALLVWEAARVAEMHLSLGPITPGLGSIGLALLLLVFTVITFLTHNEARHWPAWVGLLLSIVITVAAFRRAQTEGVDVREFGKITSDAVEKAKAQRATGTTPPATSPPGPAPTPAGGPAEPVTPPPSTDEPSGDSPSEQH